MPVPNLVEKLELTDEQFNNWVDRLDPLDREEFLYIYGGDSYQLRFICAIDYLTIQKVHFARPDDLFATAYWLSAVRYEPDLELDNPAVRNRAIRAWKSDAVQALYDRIRYRSVRQGSIRLQNKLFTLVEQMADKAIQEDDLTQKNTVANTLIRVTSLVDTQEQVMRAERTKRGLASARDAMARGMDDISERELTAVLKAAKHQLGDERVKALLAGPSLS